MESLQNFETVKYFASDKHELRQFSAMVMSELVYKGRAVESLQNFETVKYFASDKHELRQFSGMVKVSALSTPKLRTLNHAP